MSRLLMRCVLLGIFLSASSVSANVGLSLDLLLGQTMIGSEWDDSYSWTESGRTEVEEVEYMDNSVFGLSIGRTYSFDFGYDIEFGIEAFMIKLDKEFIQSEESQETYKYTFKEDYDNFGINVFFNNTYYFQQLFKSIKPFIGLSILVGLGYEHTDKQTLLWEEPLERDDMYYGIKPNIGLAYAVGERSWIQCALEYRFDISELPLSMYTFSIGYKWLTDW